MTRASAEELLTEAGAKAIPYIKQILASTNFALGLSALGPMQAKEASELLVETAASQDKTLAGAARSTLQAYPRPEAETLYFKWLNEDAGRKPVFELLAACEKIAPNKIAPYLPRILESPKSVYEFRHAFELSRSLTGKSLSPGLIKLEQQIREFGYASSDHYDQAKVDQAVSGILKSDDVEAATVIGISLAVATTKGDWRPANKAGMTILRGLPAGYGLKTAKRVADSIPDESLKEKLSLTNKS